VSPFPLSTVGRSLLAVLSLSAATIHLVMVPQHAAEWLPEGLAFAAVGWFQIGFAIVVIGRPTRSWLRAGIVANLMFVIAWAVTRTVGMPFGPEAGLTATPQLIDLTCVGAEAALVLVCSVFARHPRLGESFDSAKLVAASIVPVGVLVLTTAALASPSATHHVHGGSESADHDGTDHDGTDHGVSGAPGSHDLAADGHDHGSPAATVAAADRCDWAMNTVAFWKQNPPAAADTSHDHMTGSAAESAEPEVGNHHGLQAWKPMTDQAECTALQRQIDTMQTVAARYPTLQSALDAGCRRVVRYVPGIGAHLICYKNLANPLEVTAPEMLLYGGNQPWAPIVGLSYYSMAGTAPDASWLDGQMPFHVHEGLCFSGGQVVGGDGSTPEACAAKGGVVGGQTGYMGHYWLPSCSSPDGVFSADNPRLDKGVAEYNDDPRFDPANGGDPTPLQANPCLGTQVTVGPDDQPGAPSAPEGETAAGPTGAK
jgi:hypothetical protein